MTPQNLSRDDAQAWLIGFVGDWMKRALRVMRVSPFNPAAMHLEASIATRAGLARMERLGLADATALHDVVIRAERLGPAHLNLVVLFAEPN